jgi:hypothetical protein
LRDLIRPPGSLDWRIDQLSEMERASYQSWRERSAAIISNAEKCGAGSAYAEYLSGSLYLPEMPRSVRGALWPELEAIEAMSDPAAAYAAMLEQGA